MELRPAWLAFPDSVSGPESPQSFDWAGRHRHWRWATPTSPPPRGKGARTHLLSDVSSPFQPWGPVEFSMLTGTPSLISGRGGKCALHPLWLRGPAQPGKTPGQLFPPLCRVPLGVSLGGETLPWMKSKGKAHAGPCIPKTGSGVGALQTSPA